MKIVITHINSDFDAVTSAYAAYKIYGCNHIAVCSNFESNVEKFLSDNKFELPVKFYNQKDIDALPKIDTLIITDCCQSRRLGILSSLIEKSENIILYDHHIMNECDIAAQSKTIEESGSTTSIMCRIMQEKNIELKELEATFLSMGIFEDTGLFTYSGTKSIDALSMAWLIFKKADVTAANDYVQRELSNIQIMLLNELLLNLSIITTGGIDIAYSFAAIDEYVGEAAFIAHKLMLIEGLSTLFILVSTGSRLILIGRSNDDRVNVQDIVSKFGGGGHKYAGSAVIKDKMIAETIESLKFVIMDTVKPYKTVEEIMSTHVKSVKSGTNIQEAFDLTMKYNLNYLPVTECNRTIGIISRKDILKVINHGLGKTTSVNSIMQTEFEVIKPSAPFYDAEEIMVYQNQKLLPVESDNGIAGVVTRTDILRLIHENIIVNSKYAETRRAGLGIAKNRNIAKLMEEKLSEKILLLLKEIGSYAEKLGYKSYVVGGFVRDLLMNYSNYDIDIVIEGDAANFAQAYAKVKNAKVSVHQKFKTAVVTLPDGFKIDFATARTEYYVTPAAAPEVMESSVKSDLYRRDFTINAMAVRLDGEQYGSLLDFFMGQKDILDKKIRVLHSLSFVDDPSRAYRAIRFAVRFGFDIGSHTERLIKHAESLDLFSRITGSRKYLELKYILEEEHYIKAISLLQKYNLLRFFSSSIKYDNNLAEKFNQLENIINWYKIQFSDNIEVWQMRFNVLFYTLKAEEFNIFINSFNISSKEVYSLKNDHKYMEYVSAILKRYKDYQPSFIYKILSPLSIESLLSLGAVISSTKINLIKDYLTKYKNIHIELNGSDLLSIGIKAGPDIHKILDELRDMRLDGIISSKEEEIKYVKEKYGEKS